MLFWIIMQGIVVISYRRFGTTYRSYLQGFFYPYSIIFQQYELKQEVGHFVLRPINLLNLFVINKNCLKSRRSQSLYLSMILVIKQTRNYTGISLLLSRLTPYAEENSGNHCGFQHSRSPSDHNIFCIRQICDK
jgi:hypothetical protein